MLSQSQLDHFRERQEASLMDVCHRLVHSYSSNTHYEKVDVWTEDTTDRKCGLDQSPGSERSRTSDTLIVYDAVIRLPLSEAWNEKDKIKILKRFGETLGTPIEYGIISPIQRGPSGIRMLLRKISV